MKRGRVVSGSGKSSDSPDRISQTAWIEGEDKLHIEQISRRVSHITGFDTETAENLQVSSYGIGGYYIPHEDYFPGQDGDSLNKLYRGRGNRIATWMFYGSDVELGGATVFLYPNVTVFPKKGSAVFWHNLHRDGRNDLRTTHASCPVLLGSKWGKDKKFYCFCYF